MIDTFFNILKKSLLMLVMMIFAFVITYVPQIHTDENGQEYAANVEYAHAGAAVVFDPTNWVENAFTAIQAAADYVIQNWLYLKENVLDGIAWAIAKQLVSSLVSDIVDWINSGFEGSPAFVQDLDNFLLEAADVAVGEYINELGGLGSFVCDPFRLDVQLAVALNYDLQRERREVECSVTDVFANINDFEDFIAGDFYAGGWEGWFELTSNPNNTPYGSMLSAQTQTNLRVAGAKGEELSLLNFGDGFLSYETCNTVAGPSGPFEECYVATPGNVIAGQLNKALGAGQDQLIEADEFNEIIVALIGQLASRALSGTAGLLGLSGSDGTEYSGYSRGSFVDDLADGVIDGSGSGGASDLGDPTTDPGSQGAPGAQYMFDSLAGLDDMLADVRDYITRLQAFIANPNNDATDILGAEVALNLALDVEERIVEDINDAAPIIAAYNALEVQYQNTLDPDERTNIREQQADLVQQFSTLSVMTPQEMEIYTDRWDDLLARNVAPACAISPFAPGCPCDLDPSAPACGGGGLNP